MSTAAHSYDVEILTAVVAPSSATLSPEVARAILDWRFSDAELKRMSELAAKNRDDTLAEQERDELESFLRVGEFLNLVHAKARVSLAAETQPG